jgi:hypothetical protein
MVMSLAKPHVAATAGGVVVGVRRTIEPLLREVTAATYCGLSPFSSAANERVGPVRPAT